LEAVFETATDAKETLLDIQKIFSDDDDKIKSLKRAAQSAQKVFYEFKKKPLLTAREIIKNTEISKPTIMKSLKYLIELGIIRSVSERKWGQIFEYSAYMDRINSETNVK
jgi:Fic family protein